MPPVPTTRHADHDLLLVAAYAAGDATGIDLETAQAQVATCADCAVLHRDLRAVAAALPALPAPVRPRDFRLAPEQAARLRPSAWRRLLQPFAGPRFAFAGPLGTGLATLGIAGLLVAGSLGTPLAASAPAAGAGTGPEAAEPQLAPAVVEPEARDASPGALEFKGLEQTSPALGPAGAAAAGGEASEAPGLERATVGEEPAGALNDGAVTPRPDDLSAGDDSARAGAGNALPLLSGFALVVGVLLAGLRLAGRRLGILT